MPEYVEGKGQRAAETPQPKVREFGEFEYSVSFGTMQRMLDSFNKSIDGWMSRWGKSGDAIDVSMRPRKISLPIEGRSFGDTVYAVSVFPHPEQRLKYGARLEYDCEKPPTVHVEALYKGGELSPLDELQPQQEIGVEKGALGKIDVVPCVLDDQPALLLQYPQVSPGYWKLSNALRRRFEDWQQHALEEIRFIAKMAGFRALVAMGPAQAREDNAYKGGIISDDIIRKNYISPYQKTGYVEEKVEIEIPSKDSFNKKFLSGVYWVTRL